MDGFELVFLEVGTEDKSPITKLTLVTARSTRRCHGCVLRERKKFEIGEERKLEDAVVKECDKKKTRKIKPMRGGRKVQAKKSQDLKLNGMVEVHDGVVKLSGMAEVHGGLAELSGMAEVHGGLAELSGMAEVHDGLVEFSGMAEVHGGLTELAEWRRCTVVWQTSAEWRRCTVVWQSSQNGEGAKSSSREKG